jgi:transposase
MVVQETREIRAMAIAAQVELRRGNGGWHVPSQSGTGTYVVDPELGECNCADHETRGVECKHLMAVRMTIRRERGKNGAVKYTREVEVKYTQEWTAYNAAACEEKDRFLELLSALCATAPQAPRAKTGRPRTPTDVQAFSTTYKVYSGFSSRRFTSDLREANRRGLVSHVAHFNSVSHYMADPVLTPVLQQLITTSALPLRAVEQDFAVDSTGFSTSRFIRWYDKKYGGEVDKREWVKLHAMTGVRTNVVTAAEVTGWTAADSPYFRPLLAATAEHFDMEQVSADKAYLSRANLNAVEKFGATPFVPFKVNSLPGKGDGAWERMYHRFSFEREAFLANYHKRSNVETTFSMIKAKFGDSLLAKSDVGQMNEALCKVLCHNICCVISAIHELGIEPEFQEASTA